MNTLNLIVLAVSVISAAVGLAIVLDYALGLLGDVDLDDEVQP